MKGKNVKLYTFGFVLILLLGGTMASVSATAQANSDDGLVSKWHFDEGSGSIAKDSSGNENDGTIYGATWVDGKYGKALSFDGNGDYVEITPQSDVSAIGDFTISVWTKLKDWKSQTNSNKDRQYIFDGHSHSKTVTSDFYRTGFGLIYDGNSYTEEIHNFIYYGDGRILELNTQMGLKGKWIHHVFMRKGNMDYTYIDGQLILVNYVGYVKRDDLLNMQHNWFIGTFSGNNPNYSRGVSNYGFYGIIDEVKIYSRALTADEITTLFEGNQAVLTLTKTTAPYSIKQEQKTTVKITVENTGTTTISDIEVVDTPSTEFDFVSGETSDKYGSIKSGESRVFQYAIRSKDAGKFDLGQATAIYADEKGNYHTVKSNTPMVEVITPLEKPEFPTGEGEEKGIPGFELVFAIAGLLAVACLFGINFKKKE
ncbi:MAG: Translocon-associated protein beta (TRAPB) [ANME-2 cluster archaeon HR1]|nr:MAG: Translocon-associated protein beta (TRAPB) [ANME-2 cluster archaeon HR1]